MADNGNQGNSDQGQESGAGPQSQGQESGTEQGQQGGTQGQESGSGQQANGQQGGDQEPDFGTMSEADLRAYAARQHKTLGQVRQEAAQYRTRATAAEQAEQERQREAMTEQQRVAADLEAAQTTITEREARIQELETALDDLQRGEAIRQALSQAGALNGATAFKVGTWDSVKLKDDGTLDTEAFKAEMTKLRQSDPYLFRRGTSADAGQGRDAAPGGADGGVNDFIRGKTGR